MPPVPTNLRIEIRIQRGRIAEAIRQIGRLHVAATDELLDDGVARDRFGWLLASFMSEMRCMDSITATASV